MGGVGWGGGRVGGGVRMDVNKEWGVLEKIHKKWGVRGVRVGGGGGAGWM